VRKLPQTSPDFDQAYQRIRAILTEARNRAYQAINTAMVLAYWEIGRTIVEEEQRGKQRADYGKRVLAELSKRLNSEFGKGFDRTNLQQMRAFYLAYPKCDALRHELSWTYYRILLRVEKPEARRSTRPRRSARAGPRASWSGRSIRCSSSGWPSAGTRKVSWPWPRRGTRSRRRPTW
jgi:hypothetical protein